MIAIGIHDKINEKMPLGYGKEAMRVGFYLNSRTAYDLYQVEARQTYFVDKSKMLKELFPLMKAGNKHICLTRPRRFGKTIMANMVASFFQKHATQKNSLTGLPLQVTRNMKHTEINIMSYTFLFMMCQETVTIMTSISDESKKG